MALKAKAPEEVKPSKPKFLISGASGVGKTFFALSFPKPYLIDAEGGATRPQYQSKLKAVGGAYLGKEDGAQEFDVVIDQVKALITEKHDYKTLIIDSFSYLYMLEAAKAEEKIGSDFGRDKKEAQKPTKQLMRWLEKLDMNIILVCHSKEKWVRQGKEIASAGTTFDGYDKMEYLLDLWVEIVGKNFIVKKSRIDSLPGGSVFPLEYAKFAELYGQNVIEADVVPLPLATKEQIERIDSLVKALNITVEEVEKLQKKFDVDEWSELTQEQIVKGISYFEAKLNAINNPVKEVSTDKKKGK